MALTQQQLCKSGNSSEVGLCAAPWGHALPREALVLAAVFGGGAHPSLGCQAPCRRDQVRLACH